ncbi:MAG: DUF4147 domain-containing protein [Bacteroidetes bacterium]|nr:DUF4147 domain-containing protein [Bacteroidota bacterium]
MKDVLLQLWQAGLEAVHPEACLPSRLRRHGPYLTWSAGRLRMDRFRAIWVFGIGKAATQVARALLPLIADRLAGGALLTAPEYAADARPLEVLYGAHPLPTPEAESAAWQLWEALGRARPEDLVIWITTGGGSALWALYHEPLRAEEAAQGFWLLQRAGLPIYELNLVRRTLLRWANGGLLERLARTKVLELILCDVPGRRLEAVASGPTYRIPEARKRAIELLRERGLWERLPKAARRALEREPSRQGSASTVLGRICLASAQNALQAMRKRARALGLRAWTLTDRLEGEASEVGRLLALLADGLRPRGRGRVILWAGETTVSLGEQHGLGGRNLELALSAARFLEGRKGVALLSASTDGRDGPTDAAGAVVDGYSTAQARSRGWNLERALREHNSYPLLADLGALILTGPTGTNVADLGALLVWPS